MSAFFIGSYTEYLTPDFGGTGLGIYTVQLNTRTGELAILHTEYARNPSYLAISQDNRFLYCPTELFQSELPMVRAYQIKEDFSLEFLAEQPIAGGLPCHILSQGTNILVACYGTGNVLHFPLDSSGKLLEYQKNYYHTGSSINETRQEAPHAHQAAIHPKTSDIYVCDLGIDTLKAYQFKGIELVPNANKDCLITRGSGPRHMVFNQEGNLAYVLNELSGTISIIQNKGGTFEELNTLSTLPSYYKGEPSGSAIRMHPNGSFLYAANRGYEAITIFNIMGHELQLLAYQFTKGDILREFNITPDGKWLIACHQNSHDTVVYSIKKDGLLKETYRTKEILSPVCVVFPN